MGQDWVKGYERKERREEVSERNLRMGRCIDRLQGERPSVPYNSGRGCAGRAVGRRLQSLSRSVWVFGRRMSTPGVRLSQVLAGCWAGTSPDIVDICRRRSNHAPRVADGGSLFASF